MDHFKRNLYHLHLELEEEYAPLRKRNKSGFHSAAQMEGMRKDGRKHLDLWTDGTIYPCDPLTRATPPFNNSSSLMRFCGDGLTGLLGYTLNLQADREIARLERHLMEKENASMRHELGDLKNQLQDLKSQLRVARRKQTKLGLRQRCRALRNIENLKRGGGGCSKRIKAIRYTISPFFIDISPFLFIHFIACLFISFFVLLRSLLHPNIGERDTVEASTCYGALIPIPVVRNVLKVKRFKKAKEDCVAEFLKSSCLDAKEVQGAMDRVGISRQSYTHLFKIMQGKLKEKGLKHSLLPKPSFVQKTRHKINQKVMEMLGEPHHIEDTYHGKKKDIHFDRFNNIFIDLKTLQRAMIKFYNLKHEEVEGVAIFVIKLDESELLKGRKLERVSITLMNRALKQQESEETSQESFSVQSEQNIWWLGAFEVDVEDFLVLWWVFHRTTIPAVIQAQQEGEMLDVDGYGSYKVEWHLAGDLKTLKCMYNVSKGATAKSPCIYCMDSARDCNSANWSKAPNRHLKDKNFQPVLNIPLSNVHICTLHALCRIVEKLVYLYIGFAWKLKPLSAKEQAISCIEKVLSEMGLHGGNVVIETDPRRSGKGNDVPKKPSIGGVKARRFLGFHGKQSKQGPSTIPYNQWRALHNAVKDHGDDGRARNRKAQVWEALDKVFTYCDKSKWSQQDLSNYKKELNRFKDSMKDAWTLDSITHYIVSNYYKGSCISHCISHVMSIHPLLVFIAAYFIQSYSLVCEKIWKPLNMVNPRNGEISLPSKNKIFQAHKTRGRKNQSK